MATDSPLNNLPASALKSHMGQPKTPSPNSAHCDMESAPSDSDSNSTSPNAVSSEPKNPNNSSSASLLKKDKTSATSNASALNEKRPLSIRLWSEDDELAILNLWMDYRSKEGHYPDTDTFYELIRNLVPTKKVTKSQLMDKFRKLKKKYLNFVTKFGHEDPNSFSRIRPHELKLFELSKKIWGDVDVIDKVKTGKRKVVESNYGDNKSNKRIQEMVVEEEDSLGKEEGDFWVRYPRFKEAMEKENCSGYYFVGKKIGEKKANEMEKKWKNFQVQEAKLRLLWLELVKEQTELILDVLNKKI